MKNDSDKPFKIDRPPGPKKRYLERLQQDEEAQRAIEQLEEQEDNYPENDE